MSIAPSDLLTVVQPTVRLADPHILSDIRDRRSIIDSLYDALVRRDAQGDWIAWLAAAYTMADDCQRWTFTLRPNIRCHDGSTLTAADALASIQRAIAPDLPGELGTQGVLAAYFVGAQFAAVGQTLTIMTAAPLADLLDLLVDVPIVPAHALAGLPAQAVGSGPYRLVAAHEGQIELAAFAEHWAGTPPAARLRFIAEPDAQRRGGLLLTGGADIVVDLPVAAGPAVIAAGGVVERRTSYLCVICMANCLAGPCVDPRVRRALNLALDLLALIADPQIMDGRAQPIAGPVTMRHRGADHALAPYRHDPVAARTLLAEAGYADGLALTIDLPARFPDESIILTERIAAMLAQVGVICTLRIHEDRPGYAEMVRAKQIGDLCVFDSSPPSTYRVLCEKLDARRMGPWWQGYHNHALHTRLDQAAATADATARAACFARIVALVHDDAPWLALYAPDNLWGVGPRAQGWQPSDEGRVRVV